MKSVIAATLLIIAQVAFGAVCWADEHASSGVNGVIWLDENKNGIFEPTEPTLAGAIVNVRGEGEDFIESVLVDPDGYFEIDGLAYGLYSVWAELDGSESETVLVEINEISPVTVIDIAFLPAEQPRLQYLIWMPVVVR